MATHSSVLAWRIPGAGEPGGLLSMGSHRVGHDWSNLAAAAARTSCEWNHVLFVCDLFHSAHPCCRILQNFFLRLHENPLYVYIPHFVYPHIHQYCIWVDSAFWLLWIMLLWTWVYRYLFVSLHWILFSVYSEVELLNHVVILLFSFWGLTILISIVAVPFSIPTSAVWRSQFLHILNKTCYYVFLIK